MGNFSFAIPSLGEKFIDYRQQIPGDSFTWNWVRPMSQVRYLVIHHSAGPVTQTPDDIAAFHVRTNKWGGVGYHFIITKSGVVSYVGDLTTARANVLNYNHLVIGICLIGNFIGGKIPPDDQLSSTHLLCSRLLFQTPELPNINGWEDVIGHKQLRATACPGDTWDTWRQNLINAHDVSGDKDRIQQISMIYQTVLGRDPDADGLTHYVNSSLTIDEIRKAISESQEHQQLLNRANAFKEGQRIASDALVSIVQTTSKIEAITKLGQ